MNETTHLGDKVQDTINSARNIIVAIIAFLTCTFFAVYVSGLIFIATENLDLLKKEVIFSLYSLKILQEFGKWYFSNISEYIFYPSYYRYFIFRFTISLSPVFLFFFLSWHFRKNIYKLRPFQSDESLHGDAHWATDEDIEKAGLRGNKGMLIGKDSSGLLYAPGYQHALLFAPTGSGKGVGLVIPNCLVWEDSLIVNDIKLENYEKTSGWRQKMGQKVYVWNPAQPDGYTHCYNPIDWISEKPGQMVDDVQKISNLIIPKREFWENEARTLFVGIVLYLIADKSKTASFGEVVRTLRSDDIIYKLAVVLDTMGQEIHPVAYMNLAAFLQKADKERSGVISTLNSSLELWANPLIDIATATSDFNIMNFKKEKVTVYVGTTPDNLKRLQPLLQVFYQQATEFLVRKIPAKDEPYGVMFMMDEFPTLGKMEQFMSGIAYFRGYNVRLFLIIQDTQQLKGMYEESGMNSFLSNSTYRITFAANNIETANLISQLCGNKTVENVSSSQPKFIDLNPSSRSISISKTQRALLLPQEVINLPRDKQIVLIESFPPIKTQKIKYYQEKFFDDKILEPITVPQQRPYVIEERNIGIKDVNDDNEKIEDSSQSEDNGIENHDSTLVEYNENDNQNSDVNNDVSDEDNNENKK